MALPATDKGRILIADDEDTFAEGLADALRREGYTCKTVNDGRAVAAELHTNPQYDLLITDIRMPGNPDYDVLVRHVPEVAEGLPMILVTAFPDVAGAIKSADLPVLAYLPKPVNFPELMSHVRQAVAFSAVFRAARALEQRLENWKLAVGSVQKTLNQRRTLTGITPDQFIKDSLQQITACLQELVEMSRSVAANDERSSAESDQRQKLLDAALKACRDAL